MADKEKNAAWEQLLDQLLENHEHGATQYKFCDSYKELKEALKEEIKAMDDMSLKAAAGNWRAAVSDLWTADSMRGLLGTMVENVNSRFKPCCLRPAAACSSPWQIMITAASSACPCMHSLAYRFVETGAQRVHVGCNATRTASARSSAADLSGFQCPCICMLPRKPDSD
jgi:hypothetical protein